MTLTLEVQVLGASQPISHRGAAYLIRGIIDEVNKSSSKMTFAEGYAKAWKAVSMRGKYAQPSAAKVNQLTSKPPKNLGKWAPFVVACIEEYFSKLVEPGALSRLWEAAEGMAKQESTVRSINKKATGSHDGYSIFSIHEDFGEQRLVRDMCGHYILFRQLYRAKKIQVSYFIIEEPLTPKGPGRFRTVGKHWTGSLNARLVKGIIYESRSNQNRIFTLGRVDDTIECRSTVLVPVAKPSGGSTEGVAAQAGLMDLCGLRLGLGIGINSVRSYRIWCSRLDKRSEIEEEAEQREISGEFGLSEDMDRLVKLVPGIPFIKAWLGQRRALELFGKNGLIA